ncbi:MAG: DUF934 domain-containing protein [Aquincola sp.]|nr:DUF934 domain-containing protein [Aquincola sp.]
MKFIDSHRDAWHTVVGEDGPMPHPNPGPNRLLTLEQWHAVREHWPADVKAGVIVPNDADIETLEACLPRLGLVVLQFPKWVDGRAYSQARILRRRYRFAGEVRATGDVVVDMLPLLQRTGFDAVVLRGDQKLDIAQRLLASFPAPFPAHYQGDVLQHQPLFARSGAEQA